MSWRSPVRRRFERRHQALPGRPRARGRQLRDRRRLLPRALRRERRRQEHARKDPRRHLPPGRRPRRARRRARRLRGPQRGARRRHRHRPPGARVLREPVGGREPLPRRAARAAAFVSRAGMAARAGDARRDRRRHRRPPAGRELTIGQQQVVQIAAAIGRGARVIVFDEPTSSLSQHEAERLYDLIGGCASGRHRHLRVAPDGRDLPAVRRRHRAARRPPRGHAADRVARSRRAGRDDDRPAARRILPRARQASRARAAARRGTDAARPASATSRSRCAPAKCSGFAGLVGAGRSEIAQALFGLDPHATGGDLRAGRAVAIRTPAQAMRHGIGLVPEDRKRQGLVLSMSAMSNTTLATLGRLRARLHQPARRARAGADLLRAPARARRVPTRWPPACRAATSRRSCSRSGWPRAAGS